MNISSNNKVIVIYTHSWNPLTKEFLKFLAKKIIGKYSGPDAVRDSLLRGLQSNKVPFRINPLFLQSDTVLVLSGTKILAKAIKLKKTGKIKKLIAGPNLVIKPTDENNILRDPAIDNILVPSQWVSDVYKFKASDIADRIIVWPAGVAEAPVSTRSGEIIIFNKVNNTAVAQETGKLVEDLGYTPLLFNYGSFSHKDYLRSLLNAQAVIYIAGSESQGIALQEAWIRNIPTFVFYTGIADPSYLDWADKKINAPYLANDFGDFFTDISKLKELLSNLSSYQPAELCKKTLTDHVTTARLLTAIHYDIN